MMRAMSARTFHRRRPSRMRFGRAVGAVTICVSGLVLSAAFVGITVQANALAREKAGLIADIAVQETQHASLTAQIDRQKTSDYVQEKARDYGYIGPNETLVSVRHDGQASDPSANALNAGPSRIARWIAFFFGTR